MAIGEIMYGIGASALIAFSISVGCWKFFKWKIETCTMIGGALYGGIVSLFGMSVIAKWPLWLVTVISIFAYVFLQRTLLDFINKYYGKKEA